MDPGDGCLVEALEQADPLPQRLLEVDRPVQGEIGEVGASLLGARLPGEEIDDLLLDESRVDVHDHHPLATTLQTVTLDGDIDRALRCGSHQVLPHPVQIPVADQELIAHHRVAGQTVDAVDVPSGVGNRRSDGAEVFGADPHPDHRHHRHRAGRGRGVVDLLELDVEAALPSEEEKISDRGPFAGDPDEHVEGETATDDYLLDVVDLDLGLGQDRHQPGRDPRSIRSMDRDEDRRVFSHRPSG